MKNLCPDCRKPLTNKNCAPSILAAGWGRCRSCHSQNIFKKRKQNPKQYILNRARGNAKVAGIKCVIKLKDIPDIPKFCPVLPWIKLVYRVGTGIKTRRPDSPSLDRIDNTKGYLPGNIRIISWRANELKKDATPKELIALALDASKHP
jgi:hypothetical protein